MVHSTVRRFAGLVALAGLIGMGGGTLDSAPLDGVGVDAPPLDADTLLRDTGFQGGLIVHLGCGDGMLTAALGSDAGQSKNRLVHGLDADENQVRKAREHVRAQGVYGTVSIAHWDRRELPYNDGLVNVVVCGEPEQNDVSELMRILVPGGVLYAPKNGQWTKLEKPRTDEIDEWTHYLHDPSNNAVAHDSIVGPPSRLQWNGGPKWTRSHETMSGLTAMVSAQGRLFYILDEGPTVSVQLPPIWTLIARDAFNGVILWKRKIPTWQTHLWPLKGGPAELPRRLVAVGDRVYATLGIEAGVTALDAVTGETVMSYDDTAGTQDIIYSDGILVLNVNDAFQSLKYKPEDTFIWNETARARRLGTWDPKTAKNRIVAVDASSGKQLWSTPSPVVARTLAVDQLSVYFNDGEAVVCLHRGNGKRRWKSKPVGESSLISTAFTPTLVVHQDVVLFLSRQMTSLDAATGEKLWSSQYLRSGHNSPGDALVVNDLVWSGGSGRSNFVGRELRTGKIKVSFPPDQEPLFHPRCHPSKATDKFLISSRIGLEFADFSAQSSSTNRWTRGACLYGIMPCNGLIYTPPHSCTCYMEAKTTDFNALAPESTRPAAVVEDTARLVRGPAYPSESSLTARKEDSPVDPDAWPTYRHDVARSGATSTKVPAQLSELWTAGPGGIISSPVAAAGSVFVTTVDAHSVLALDAQSGRLQWQHTVNGRVDSPPAIHNGTVLFGSRDGWVYCLRATDGQLIWRFLAAPVDRLMVSYGQLESVGPVHGSVLVQNGVVHFVAGRSMFLDGGLRLYRLDATTGELLSVTVMDGDHPTTGEDLNQLVKQNLTMPTALPDILSSDGERIYMRSQQFDMQGDRIEVAASDSAAIRSGAGTHLFNSAGFLDDTWSHRNYWIYGSTVTSGWPFWFRAGRYAPAGRILAFNGESVFGFGRRPEYFGQSSVMEYQLFRARKKPRKDGAGALTRTAAEISKLGRNTREKREGDAANWRFRQQFTAEQLSAIGFQWRETNVPLLARALVLTDDVLFIAGPPDLVDEESVFDNRRDPKLARQLARQAEAWEGKHGAILQAVSTKDGELLAQMQLPTIPVFDGMIAADQKVYVALVDGRVMCLGHEP